MIALAAAALFDGEAERGGGVVLIEGGTIRDVVAVAPAGVAVERLPPEVTLAPGFIDLQVNGGDNVLFNDVPTVDGLRRIAAAHLRLGTTSLLPTLISASRALQREALAAVRAAIAAGVPGIAGIHIEGPFIAAARRGIHPLHAIRPLEAADIALLTEAAPAPLLVTLAPDIVAPAEIAALAAAGVTVFLGHTDATLEQASGAFAQGARGATHLFNAMSQFGSRAPGTVGAVLDDPAAFASLIADGHHVHFAALRVAWRALGPRRLLLISDAMPTVGADAPAGFVLDGKRMHLAGTRLTDDAGTLAGAHISMADAVRIAVREGGIPRHDALRMATATPAECIGLSDRGRIARGRRADFVALDLAFAVAGVWSGGARIV